MTVRALTAPWNAPAVSTEASYSATKARRSATWSSERKSPTWAVSVNVQVTVLVITTEPVRVNVRSDKDGRRTAAFQVDRDAAALRTRIVVRNGEVSSCRVNAAACWVVAPSLKVAFSFALPCAHSRMSLPWNSVTKTFPRLSVHRLFGASNPVRVPVSFPEGKLNTKTFPRAASET